MFERIIKNSILSFRNSRSILKLESKRLALRKWKCHIDLESLRLEFYAKKIFTYNSIFKPYSDILKPCSGVFLPKKKYKYQVWEPYSDVLKPYSGVFKKNFRSTRFGSPIVTFLSTIVTFLCSLWKSSL